MQPVSERMRLLWTLFRCFSADLPSARSSRKEALGGECFYQAREHPVIGAGGGVGGKEGELETDSLSLSRGELP